MTDGKSFFLHGECAFPRACEPVRRFWPRARRSASFGLSRDRVRRADWSTGNFVRPSVSFRPFRGNAVLSPRAKRGKRCARGSYGICDGQHYEIRAKSAFRKLVRKRKVFAEEYG